MEGGMDFRAMLMKRKVNSFSTVEGPVREAIPREKSNPYSKIMSEIVVCSGGHLTT